MFRKLTPKFTFFITLALLIALAGTALVQAAVRTDKPDYLPGSVVTISGDNSDGAGFLPGETVKVAVTGPNGYSAACEGVADDAGAWSCQVYLVNDYSAVGSYSYVAVGLASGVKETGYFTDDPGAKVKFATAGLPNGTSVSVNYSGNNNGGKPISGSDTFTSPGPSSGTSFDAASSVTFTFPPEIVSGGKSYRFVNSDISSPATAGAPQSSMTITGKYEIACTAPSITAQPANVTKTLGETATFSVTASGTSLTYQWQKDGNNIQGANNPTYTINSVSSGDAGNYTVAIGSACGSITSNSAALTYTKATPVITWDNPLGIFYGTALSETQLNATVNVAGTFKYTPAAGVKLNAGPAQTLSVSFTPDDAANYNPASKTVSINVAMADPVITWADPADIVYGTALSAAQLNAAANVPGTFAYSPDFGANLNAGVDQTLSVTFTPTDGNNFNKVSATAKITVLKATPVITWANPADIVFDTLLSATQLNAAADVAGNLTYNPAPGTKLNAGPAQALKVDFAPSDPANYITATKTVFINVIKADQTITFGTLADKIYGDPTFTMEASASSGLTVTFIAAGNCTVSTASVSITGAGSCTITASQVGDGNYNPAPAISQTFKIAKATPVIIWSNPADIVYGTPLDGTQLNATSSVTGSMDYTPKVGTLLNAGDNQTLSVTFTPTDTANYNGANATVTIKVTSRPITITADAKTKVYGDTDPALTYQITDGTLVSGDAFNGSLTRDAGEIVGSYHINLGTLALNGNYSLNYAGANLTITKATLIVTPVSVSREYGEPNPTFTATYAGFKNGETLETSGVSGSPSLTTSSVAASPVGQYTITIAQDTLAAGNYDFSFVNGTLTVTKAPLTVTAANKTRLYGDANPAFSATITGFKNDETLATSGVTGTPNLSTSAIATSPVSGSPYTITAALGTLSAANYSFTFVSGTLDVNPAPLTITANSREKTYGDAVSFAGNEFTVSDLVTGDSVTSVTLTSAGTSATASVKTYAIVPSDAVGTGLANYDIKYVDGTLTVNPKALTITANNQAKIYGADFTFTGTEFTVSGLVNGNTVTSVSLASDGAAATAVVNTYPIVASAAVGTGLDNYNIGYAKGTLTINPKALTITANDQKKTYGGIFTFLGTEFTTNGLVNDDKVTSVTLTSAGAAATAKVGIPYDIVAIDAVGTGLDNYTITYVKGTLTIAYDFPGFLQPINDTAHTRVCPGTCTLSVFKAGSTVPVKFQILDASGKPVQAATNPIFMKPIPGAIITAPVDEAAIYATADSTMTFRWDATSQQYIYNWSTKGFKAGVWYAIGVTLDDGKQYVVIIGLR